MQGTIVVTLVPPAVVKVTVFLADINDYPAVNEVYSQCEYC